MKKIIALFATLLVSLSVSAAQFEEGKHYSVLDTKASSKPTVVEYFSFYCPHCYSMEPVINLVKKELPNNVKLQKNHVSFMGGAMGSSMSKAYATMAALKIEDKMIPVMFTHIHDMNKPPRNDEELRQIFLDEGIDAKKFDSTFNSFVVDSMLRRSDKGFKEAKLKGVPSVVVNNKYLVTATNTQDFVNVVTYLLDK